MYQESSTSLLQGHHDATKRNWWNNLKREHGFGVIVIILLLAILGYMNIGKSDVEPMALSREVPRLGKDFTIPQVAGKEYNINVRLHCVCADDEPSPNVYAKIWYGEFPLGTEDTSFSKPAYSLIATTNEDGPPEDRNPTFTNIAKVVYKPDMLQFVVLDVYDYDRYSGNDYLGHTEKSPCKLFGGNHARSSIEGGGSELQTCASGYGHDGCADHRAWVTCYTN